MNFDGEHSSWVYKHWKCISEIDLEHAKQRYDEDSIDGLDNIPGEYKEVVVETFKTGKVVEPPQLEMPARKARKAGTKKEKLADGDSEDSDGPKPRRTVDRIDVSEEEYVPKKTRSRRAGADE